MNFLAHFHLAHDTDASRVGALLGDFVRGTPQSLRGKFPDEVIAGIQLHRSVDAFTDSHSLFPQAKQLLSRERKRFAGIIVDVFYDHFLAVHWKEYSDEPLHRFIDQIYLLLERRGDWLPTEIQAFVPRIEAENWLGHYTGLDDLALTFRRLSTRRSFLGPLANAVEDLTANYGIFEGIFKKFYPDVCHFARQHPVELVFDL